MAFFPSGIYFHQVVFSVDNRPVERRNRSPVGVLFTGRLLHPVSASMLAQPLLPSPQTLTQQVTQILRRGLDDGVWKDYLPGEVELSSTLRVSRMTLRASLAALTKEGLLVASRGRKRRILIGSLGSGKKRAINRPIIVLTAVPMEMLPTLHILQVEGLRERLANGGYVLEVRVCRAAFSAKPVRVLERLTTEKPAAAWVLLNSSAAMQTWFMKWQIPCVIIGAAHPGVTIPALGTDYWAIGHHAAGLFLRRGHRRLAVVVPDDGKAGHMNTELGFRAAVAGVADASIHLVRHNGEPDALFAAIGTLLKRARPTGFLVAMPPFVLTTLSALAAAGANVPRDVSLISRDSDFYLDFMRPSIARYEIDVPSYVKKICHATLLVARGSMPRIRAQQLLRDFIAGETLGSVPAR